MRSYLSHAIWMSCVLLVIFGVAQFFELETLLGVPTEWMHRWGAWSALFSVIILWGDIILPIPSSLLMTANGACFGFVLGTLISLLGGVGATWIAWWIGKRARSLHQQYITIEEQINADKYLTKWGSFAILVTRPIPIIAETVALLSGTLPISGLQIVLYAALGHVLPCLIYAYIGASVSIP